MKYERYETALSAARIGKYKSACYGDKNKALILYRYCQLLKRLKIWKNHFNENNRYCKMQSLITNNIEFARIFCQFTPRYQLTLIKGFAYGEGCAVLPAGVFDGFRCRN